MINSRMRTALATVTVVAAATAQLTLIAPAAHATSPGGVGLISYDNLSGIAFIANADGSNAHQLTTDTGAVAEDVAWSPDGTQIAFTGYVDGASGLMVTKPDGTGTYEIPGSQYNVNGELGWYAGGSKLVFSYQWGYTTGSRLYTAASNGSDQAPHQLVPGSSGCDIDPSANGNLIAYVHDSSFSTTDATCSGTQSVWVYNISTGTTTQLLADAFDPNISPDGTQIAYTQTVDGVSQVFTANIDGSNPQQLTTSAQGASQPSWSPDGKQIAYTNSANPYGTGATSGTVAMNLADKSITTLSATGVNPAWQPVTPTYPAATGTQGVVAFNQGGNLQVTGAAGTSSRTVATKLTGAPAWSPTGNDLVYSSQGSIWTMRIDGHDGRQVTKGNVNSPDVHPALNADGSFVLFSRGGVLYGAATDGSYAGHEYKVSGPAPVSGETDDYPAISNSGVIYYEKDLNYAGSIEADKYSNGKYTVSQVLANAAQPAPSPDSKQLAFVRADANGVLQVFVANADGSGIQQLTHSASDATNPSWSADGTAIVYTQDRTGLSVEVDATTGSDFGTQIGSVSGSSAAYARSAGDAEVRIAGSTAIGTSVAESQATWATQGSSTDPRDKAGAVVLTRSNEFYDAIAGASLAVDKKAPLLYTPTSSLDSSVKAEIKRILPKGGTVYLLGETSALSTSVSNSVTALGMKVVRVAGANQYATAVAIAKTVNPHPTNVLVLNGASYTDALSAGATGEPIVLTDNSSLPSDTANYLNSLNPNPSAKGGTAIYPVGGDGYKAVITNGYLKNRMPKWPSQISTYNLVGANSEDTSLLIAKAFFTSNDEVAMATNNGWQDGLSGGAMMGHFGGPVITFNPKVTLYAPIAAYLTEQSTSLSEIDLLGGTPSIPASQQAPIAATLGGKVTYYSFTGNPSGTLARSLSLGSAVGLVPLNAGTASTTAPAAAAVSAAASASADQGGNGFASGSISPSTSRK